MEDSRRVRSSEWLVTINTNKKFRDGDQLQAAALNLMRALDPIFGERVNVEKIIDVMQVGDSFEEHVGTVHSDVVVENARSGLHAHVQMRSCHLTKLHIRINALRLMIIGQLQKSMQVSNVYVNVKHIRSDSSNVRNYIYKNVRGKNLRLCDGETEFPESVQVTHTMSVASMGIFSQTRL